jgi:hypothetical protein
LQRLLVGFQLPIHAIDGQGHTVFAREQVVERRAHPSSSSTTRMALRGGGVLLGDVGDVWVGGLRVIG